MICRTCGRDTRDGIDMFDECCTCIRAWGRARRSPGYLPTVELFPELVPEPAPAPAVQLGLDLGKP